MHAWSTPSSDGRSLAGPSTPSCAVHHSPAPSFPPATPPGASHFRPLDARPNQASARRPNRLHRARRVYHHVVVDKTFVPSIHPPDRTVAPAPIDRIHSLQDPSPSPSAAGPDLIPALRQFCHPDLDALLTATWPSDLSSVNIFTHSPSSNAPAARSLTSSPDVAADDMTTVTSAPGSPPDLSGSRSSKSSSTCSTSQFSSHEGALADVSNFEEIGLEDDRHKHDVGKLAENGAPAVKTPSIVQTHVSETARDLPSRSLPPQYSPKRPTYPSLHGQVHGALSQNRRQTVRMPKSAGTVGRTFTSPSLPAFSPSLVAPQQRPRSTSPRDHLHEARLAAARAGDGLHPISSSTWPSTGPPRRRGSWQPHRKSVVDLEAECHDSDDELPDDASLWNVPMSPRPPEERISPGSSHRGSPERDAPGPIPLAHAITAPATLPPKRYPFSQPMPRKRPPPPRTSSLHTATLSNPSSPRTRTSLRDTRAKSWTLAIAELSEEAQVLTHTLEHHAARTEKAREDRIQTGQRSSRPSLEAASNRSSRSAIVLPPIQKSNLDFMPISKEKEAILSRTRPSWLPPKDPREEKRHLREYQRMMAASMDAERKKEEKLLMQECWRDQTRDALNIVWQEFITPGIDPVTAEHQTRDLWWRGVTPKYRGEVWQRAIGNQLSLNRTSYEKALQRAKDIQGKKPEDLSDKEKVMLGWFGYIERDAETAFPDLHLFQRGGPLRQDLIDVCAAYACYRSDAGYVYGMQLVSALLLLQLHSPTATFVLLANCLNRPMPLAFLTTDISATTRTYGLAIETLRIKFPRLHNYLFNYESHAGLAMTGDEVFEPMFRTLFSNGLDLERLCRVWDVWVFDGDRTWVRTAVAVLGCLQSQIYNVQGSVDLRRRNIQEMLAWGPHARTGAYWDLMATGNENAFIEEVREAGKLNYTGR